MERGPPCPHEREARRTVEHAARAAWQGCPRATPPKLLYLLKSSDRIRSLEGLPQCRTAPHQTTSRNAFASPFLLPARSETLLRKSLASSPLASVKTESSMTNSTKRNSLDEISVFIYPSSITKNLIS